MSLRSGSARKLLSAVLLVALTWGVVVPPCPGADRDGPEAALSGGCCHDGQPEPGQAEADCPCPCSQATGVSASPTLEFRPFTAAFPQPSEVGPGSVAAGRPLRVPIA